jgi:prefoldin subunit 5
MRERMELRLAELNAEYSAGQKLLADLKANQASLEETLIRISGAIEVLEELLNPTEA